MSLTAVGESMDYRYVVFFDGRGIELYWTGEILEYRMPGTTADVAYAKQFETSREAYDDAGQYKKLQHFRVGRRWVAEQRAAA